MNQDKIADIIDDGLQVNTALVIEHYLDICDSRFGESLNCFEMIFLVSFLTHQMFESLPYWHQPYVRPILRPQYKIGKYRVDFAIVQERIKVAIELDGFAWHDRNKIQFRAERERQNYLIGKGWFVLRYTWDQVTKSFESVYDEIGCLLFDVAFQRDARVS